MYSRYKCVATNDQGEATAEGDLIVKSITTIVTGPRDRTETHDTSIVMECEVVADTSVELNVIWKKDNKDLGQEGFEQNDRVYQDENNTLVLSNITQKDSGNVFHWFSIFTWEQAAAKDLIDRMGINAY